MWSLALLALAAPLPRQTAPEVRAALVADVAAVVPGETFHLALHLELPVGWHVYWRNPGDSGAPTTFAVSAPEGFEVGAVRFPGPERHELGGGLACFVHEGELVLSVEVAAPADLSAGQELRFEAAAGWLVCKEACYLGKRDLALALPVADGAPRPGAGSALLTAWSARFPRADALAPAAEGGAGVTATWSGTDERPAVDLTVPGADAVDWFPAPDAPLELLERAEHAGAARARRLTLTFAPPYGAPDAPRVARGLLSVRRGERTTYYDLDLARDAGR